MKIPSRILRPLACTLAGCAIGAVAVGAATPDKPKNIRLGEIGLMRTQKDMVVFRFEGRDYVLRYYKWDQPIDSGRVHYMGSIYGHLFEEAKEQAAEAQGGGSPPARRKSPEKAASRRAGR